jgi:predicted phosphodiesterase
MTMPKLKLQIVSDLHLEFRDPKKGYDFLKPCAPILVICGDACVLGTAVDFSKYEKFITYIYDKYEHIIHVPGNHEYYTNTTKNAKGRMSMKQIDEKMKEFIKWYPKLHYLNNSVFRLKINSNLYYFIGTTMWTKIAKNEMEFAQESMNDYTYIVVDGPEQKHAFSPMDAVLLHKKATGFLKRAIERAKNDGANAIIITHHKPYDSDEKTDFSKIYEVDMRKFMQSPVKAWFYGHTHQHDNTTINGVKIISNPHGYPFQRGVGYVPGFCVEV